MKIIWRGTRVLAETLVGYLLIVAGVVMLVTPGPGVVAIIAGLAILSRHYRWAERSKRASLARIHDSRTAMRARLAARRAGGDAAAPLPDEPASDDHRPVDGDRQRAA